jgi:hypothetical protein
MGNFEALNKEYIQRMGEYRPTWTVIGFGSYPVLLTMNLTPVTGD